ncbi:hypothetical protein ACFQY4_11400 [Catellatospora bangladeshensis]|uniref:Alanine-rich protein n=1 Tax=Catellatospora bangladeshensis TaxID=310355 RepID=A0A8J3JBL5_9ACTN|nr:hypothetical protein [Catellatospora bangladeshensis]GIF81857.1 hypothetical protein Cba03nite_32060 [Catellatospora bangladeshensis]
MVISVHAFPWDVLGDGPGFVERFERTGADAVTLAVSYHSTRAATPLHPARRLVDARYAALYRPVREAAWAGRRLVPQGPDWTAEDAAGEAAELLRAAGIPVNAWVVLAHNTRLGLAHPDLSVRNCFGERYPYALCPSQPEVREHCALLAAEALRGLPVSGVSLESAGQMGVAHLGCHEKTDGAFSPPVQRLLSICCCEACTASWTAAGLDPGEALTALRDAVRAGAEPPGGDDLAGGVGIPGRGGPWLPGELASELLSVRQAAAAALQRDVLAAVREHAPQASITLHGHPDPWAAGPSPGLPPRLPSEVDKVLVPCWPTDPGTADLVSALAGRATVDAYVTVLPPARPDDLSAHVARLREAGAARLSLYHLGLAGSDRQPLLATLVKEFRG